MIVNVDTGVLKFGRRIAVVLFAVSLGLFAASFAALPRCALAGAAGGTDAPTLNVKPKAGLVKEHGKLRYYRKGMPVTN